MAAEREALAARDRLAVELEEVGRQSVDHNSLRQHLEELRMERTQVRDRVQKLLKKIEAMENKGTKSGGDLFTPPSE